MAGHLDLPFTALITIGRQLEPRTNIKQTKTVTDFKFHRRHTNTCTQVRSAVEKKYEQKEQEVAYFCYTVYR